MDVLMYQVEVCRCLFLSLLTHPSSSQCPASQPFLLVSQQCACPAAACLLLPWLVPYQNLAPFCSTLLLLGVVW